MSATSRARLPYASGEGRAGIVSILPFARMSSWRNARVIPGEVTVTSAPSAPAFKIVLRAAFSRCPVGFAAGLNESAVLWLRGTMERMYLRTTFAICSPATE